jgi:predicted phage terminase large subunit-like protein
VDYESFVEKMENDHKNRAIVAELCRHSFERYFETVFFLVNGSKVFFKPFHRTIISKLQAIVDGRAEKRNLGICVPVGSGKSLIIEYFITWCFARSVNTAFCYVSHSESLITRMSKETRDIIEHPMWRTLFGAELKKDERARINYSFAGAKNRTGMTARAAGAGVTGLDAGNPNVTGFSGSLIIDDPLDAGAIRHELARKECRENYARKLATRRRTPTTPTIVIMQRLHIEDLIGWAKENEPGEWDFVEIPALSEDGVSFWPERYPAAELERIREVDPFLFYSQYQQSPIVDGGSLIKAEWWKYYDETEDQIKRKSAALIAFADTAFSEKSSADYSVIGLAGFTGDALYWIDVWRGRWSYETLLEKVIEFWGAHSDRGHDGKRPTIDRLYIENKASGLSLLGQAKTFRKNGINAFPWEAAKFIKDGDGKGDKVARVNQAKLSIYAGKVLVPSDMGIGWVDGWIAEHSSFNAEMTHSHDDQVDVGTMGILTWQALAEGRI